MKTATGRKTKPSHQFQLEKMVERAVVRALRGMIRQKEHPFVYLAQEGGSFGFLHKEPDTYSIQDVR